MRKKEKLISEWVEADKQASFWKAREMELRKELFADLFPAPVEGAGNKIRIGYGKAIQATHKINRTIQKGPHDELRKSPNIAPIIAEITSYKPELKVKEWKALDKQSLLLVASMVTEKPGAPELEIKDEAKIRW